MRRAYTFAAAMPLFIAIAGCQTSNGADWSRTGVGTTPYRQAERTCLAQTKAIEKEDNQHDFFVACMAALGWAPQAGATVNL